MLRLAPQIYDPPKLSPCSQSPRRSTPAIENQKPSPSRRGAARFLTPNAPRRAHDGSSRGIFIVTKLSQVSKWKLDSRRDKPKEDSPEPYVVQRYISNPYLVAGRKFDMRLYVLLTSFMPMSVRTRLDTNECLVRVQLSIYPVCTRVHSQV